MEEGVRLHPFDVHSEVFGCGGGWKMSITVSNAASPSSLHVHSVTPNLTCDRPSHHSTDNNRKPKAAMSVGCADVFTLEYAESFTILYDINYTPATKTEVLAAAVVISWSHAEDHVTHCTTHQLPKIKIRRYPFVMSPTVECLEVQTSTKFSVKYDMRNNFHDFLGVKLYWSPSQAQDSHNSDGVICHDPNLHLGAFSKNSSLSGSIEFEILHPGIYELGKAMKINLQYALGGVEHVGGPRLSLSPAQSPRHTNQRPRSTTSKSQSLNDILPVTQSPQIDRKVTNLLSEPRKSVIDMFAPVDDALNPTNFLKNNLYVVVT